jgi:subtilisin-like proprotein convertase family protein
MPRALSIYAAAGAAIGLAGFTLAQAVISEQEPNDSKAQATPANLNDGDSVTGTTTGSSSSAGPDSFDYFLIRTPAAPPGIYRHRLTLTTTGAPGHVGTIRARNQAGGAIGTQDAMLQSSSLSSAPARVNQWYGFGRQEGIYYRVAGNANTTAPYTATLTSDPITPTSLGLVPAGQITITTVGQGHSTDTDLWVYDSTLTAIPGYGNDEEPAPGATHQSTLTRSYEPGTYYLALTNFNFANNLASPPDDRDRAGLVFDFPDAVGNSNSATGLDLSFAVISSGGTQQFGASKTEEFGVSWFSFVVVGVAPSGACCNAALGTCAPSAPVACAFAGGVYRGDGTDCSTAGCALGACCLPDGTCAVVAQAVCAAQSGVYAGNTTSCTGASCTPVGACCRGDGSCSLVTRADCLNVGGPQGGLYRGDAVLCGAVNCTAVGACCLLDGTCAQISALACHNGGGLYSGDAVACAAAACPVIYTYTGSPVAIPDGDCASTAGAAPITVPDNFIVAGADAAFTITHPYDGELRVTLKHDETGTSVVLLDGVGSFRANFGNPGLGVFFRSTDQSPYEYNAAPPGVLADYYDQPTGDWRPHNPLAPFIGEASAGTWRLIVQDCFTGNTGTINAFRLALRAGAPITGACCAANGSCSVITQSACASAGGTYRGDNVTCAVANCTPATGACCAGNGSCTVVSQASCVAGGGSYQGDNMTCAQVNCPLPTGACCVANGSCTVVSQASCVGGGGAYQGDNVTCLQANCPQPTGACCATDGTCSVITQAACAGASGVYHGDNVTCVQANCTPPTGACCTPRHSCSLQTQTACAAAGGSYHGDNVTCAGSGCSQCYANCDSSTGTPFLNVIDFTCFFQKFNTSDPYANCDGSTAPPVLNVIDFTCYFQKFAIGCSAP